MAERRTPAQVRHESPEGVAESRSAAASKTTPSASPEDVAPHPAATELDLLEDAQQALAHDPGRALALLAEHASAFPHGKFAQERDVLRLDALERLHDTAALRAGADAFLARYPRSPHRARVTALLDALP